MLPFEIPDNWCWSRFSSLYSLTSGQNLSPNDYNSDKNGVAYITGASNITNEKIDINRRTIHPKSIAILDRSHPLSSIAVVIN